MTTKLHVSLPIQHLSKSDACLSHFFLTQHLTQYSLVFHTIKSLFNKEKLTFDQGSGGCNSFTTLAILQKQRSSILFVSVRPFIFLSFRFITYKNITHLLWLFGGSKKELKIFENCKQLHKQEILFYNLK